MIAKSEMVLQKHLAISDGARKCPAIERFKDRALGGVIAIQLKLDLRLHNFIAASRLLKRSSSLRL